MFSRWRRYDKERFYLETGATSHLGKMVSVPINLTGSKLESSVPRPLFEPGYVDFHFGHTGNWKTYAISADGQRFLIPLSESNRTSELANTPITIVLNWPAGLQK
jgi:hypothetical protein